MIRMAKTTFSAPRWAARRPADRAPSQPPGDAAGNEHRRQPPVQHPRQGIVAGGGQAEGGDRDQRGTDGVQDRHPGRQHQAGHHQEAAADPEESGQRPGADPDAEQFRQVAAAQPDTGIALARAPAQHERADHQHQHREQRQQPLPVDQLAEGRAGQRAGGAGLITAGVTGFCGLARLLARAPWNRAAYGPGPAKTA